MAVCFIGDFEQSVSLTLSEVFSFIEELFDGVVANNQLVDRKRFARIQPPNDLANTHIVLGQHGQPYFKTGLTKSRWLEKKERRKTKTKQKQNKTSAMFTISLVQAN